LQDSLFNIAGGFGGSAHSETLARTAKTNERIAVIQQQTATLAATPSDGKPNAGHRLPGLRTQLVAIRGILDDGLSELDRLTVEIAARLAERNERDRESRASDRRPTV
jgi:hypothetical protein